MDNEGNSQLVHYYIFDKVCDAICFTFTSLDVVDETEHYEYAKSLVEHSPNNYIILKDAKELQWHSQ